MKQLFAAACGVLLLTSACTTGRNQEQTTTRSTPAPVQPGDPMPGRPQETDPLLGVPVKASQDDASGGKTEWETTVRSTQWITADKVHGTSGTWIGSAKVYLAIDVEYRALAGTMVYSTIDWSFEGTSGQQGILGEAGPGSAEEGAGLDVAGELAAGSTIAGRVYFGLPAPTAGTLSYDTLAEGTLAEWLIPTR